MARSYKPVFLLALLQHADENGRANVADVAASLRQFYVDRVESSHAAELRVSPMLAPTEISDSDLQFLINKQPFGRFEWHDYLNYSVDRAFYQINKNIWRELKRADKREKVEAIARESIEKYYSSAD